MRVFRFRRSCPNCTAEWPRWRYCTDCWRMIGKTLTTAILSEIVAYLAHHFFF